MWMFVDFYFPALPGIPSPVLALSSGWESPLRVGGNYSGLFSCAILGDGLFFFSVLAGPLADGACLGLNRSLLISLITLPLALFLSRVISGNE